MGPECACGCGGHLPEGSLRKYKNGHKANPVKPRLTVVPDFEDEAEPFTLSDAADMTEKDPEPEDTEERVSEAPIRITRAVRKDVEGKLAFMMTLAGSMWVSTDPICGGTFLNQTPEIAAKLTPILCQSPDVVKWFRKSAGYMLYVDLLTVVYPVVQAIYAHHVAKGSANGPAVDPQAPVYAS